MKPKRINIKTAFSINIKIFLLVFTVIFCILFEFLGFVISLIICFVLALLFSYFNQSDKKEYLSYIDVLSDEFVFTYKMQNKILRKQAISKNEIQSIEVVIKANDNAIYGDYSSIGHSSVTVTISLNNSTPIIIIQDNSKERLYGGPFDLALNFIKIGKFLPNFSYRIDGISELANKEIEYCLKTGHGFNLLQRLFNMGFYGIIGGLLIISVILLCLFTIYVIVFL